MAASPEVRLKRFLHYGSELPIYNASRTVFTHESCPSINTLIAAGKHEEVGEQIIKAHSDGYAVHREAILHAMAVCALNKTSESLREMAYNAVKTVCVHPEELFLFITYLHKLNHSKINKGHGLKRAISNWYLERDVMEFAEIVSKKRGYYKWTHADLMRIAHIKSCELEKQVVIQYVFNEGSVKYLRVRYKYVSEVQPVLRYLSVATEVRTSNDPKMVSKAIESYSLTLDHLSHHNRDVLYSDEVWCSLVTGMTLEELLDQLQFVSRHQLLQPNCENMIRRYCDAISNFNKLADSKVHPARVLIHLYTFILIDKEKIGSAAKLNTKRNPYPANSEIVEVLSKLMESSFSALVPTGLRYVVAIDIRSRMRRRRCWKSRYVTCANAAALLALSVVRCEREVAVGLYAGATVPFKVIHVANDTTFEALVARIKENQQEEWAAEAPSPKDTPIVKQMLDWAERNKHSADFFIALGDHQMSTTDLATNFNRYRSVMGLRHAKLVYVHLDGPISNKDISKGSGLLAVHGFDENVPRVIEAFARGAF